MSYRVEGNDLVWEGVENGIAPSITRGMANLQNANINTETGEAMASFARVAQSFTQAQITNGTLTASVPLGTQFLSTSAALQVGQWINISSSNINLVSAKVHYGLVAGGGGGGGNNGSNVAGGGAAGGRDVGELVLAIGTYAVTIGTGGAGGANTGAPGTNGVDTTITTLARALGGGGGGGSLDSGKNGGSGGGMGNGGADVGLGLPGQGNDGGEAATGGGGGGGSNAAGHDAVSNDGGAGGAGGALSIPAGGAGPFCGGGGGGSDGGGGHPGGAGGTGGGGTGGDGTGGNPTNGSANTGGGGGGAGNGADAGGNGGSGIAIITYLTGTLTATGGTITTSGAYTIHTFTSSGDFVITAIPLPAGYYFVNSIDGSGNITLSYDFDPAAAFIISHGTSGTATFSTTHRAPDTAFIAKATEKYQTATATKYRYYMLDGNGYIWCYDTIATSPKWMLTDPTDYSSYDFTGMTVLNGWLLVLNNENIYGKPTVNLGPSFQLLDNSDLNNPFPTHNNFAYTGHQGKAFYCDGNYIGEIFPTTSIQTSLANVQSYAAYSTGSVSLTATGALSPSATGLILTTAWTAGVADAQYLIRFSSGEERTGTLDDSKTVFTWTGGLIFDATASITVISICEVSSLINGSMPYITNAAGTTARIPAVFFHEPGGTQPTNLDEETVYWIERWVPGNTFAVYADSTGGDAIDVLEGASGQQYFNTFYPIGDDAGIFGDTTLVQYTPQRMNLPSFEVATSLVEVGNVLLAGGITNTVYPWNQVDALPGDLISLPEAGVVMMINVNNMGYIFAGNKGNIYITNASSASLVYKIPDYVAGVPGTPLSYIEPVFTWGDADYIRGRVYMSILDQTATKAGNCGGVWSFVPPQNFFSGQDTGIALRLENQNSYGDYDGMATLILGNQEQNSVGPQYWTGWQDSYSVATSSAFGIDGPSSNPVTTFVIETELIPIGTFFDKTTLQNIEFKMTTELTSGDSVAISWRKNSTDAWTAFTQQELESSTPLSGIYRTNQQDSEWIQLRGVFTTGGTTSSSFDRFSQFRLR